jgi:hypothetical protein
MRPYNHIVSYIFGSMTTMSNQKEQLTGGHLNLHFSIDFVCPNYTSNSVELYIQTKSSNLKTKNPTDFSS